MNDFYNVVRKRRMVRNYTDEPVPLETINRILEAARKAPSAGFSQGQAMIAVTEATQRKAIAKIADEEKYLARGMDPWISRAPVHVIVCVSKKLYLERYAESDKKDTPQNDENWPVPYWWVDAGATMMTLLLSAVAEGLSAGFLGSHRMPELQDILGIPAHMKPIGIVTIGHPAPDRPSSSLSRGRRAVREVIHHERW